MSQDLKFTNPAQYTNTRTKQYPKRLTPDQIKFNLEVSDTDIPAEGVLPNKYLPTVKVIKGQDLEWQPIVIPVGTIVSAVSTGAAYTNNATVYDESGNIGVGTGYDTNAIMTNYTDSMDAYGRTNISLVPANGGEDVTDPYHAYDLGVTPYDDAYIRVNPDGNQITSSDSFSRLANIPIGIAFYDIFLDDAGAYLNYTANRFEKFSSFETDKYIQVVYVSRDVHSGWRDDRTTIPAALKALGIPMLYTDTPDDLIVGRYVQPNFDGKFSIKTDASATTASKTVQDVGRLVSFASNYPKGLEGDVITLPGAANGGSDTYGLHPALYQTAVTILQSTSSPVDYNSIKTLLDNGQIGFARINLKV